MHIISRLHNGPRIAHGPGRGHDATNRLDDAFKALYELVGNRRHPGGALGLAPRRDLAFESAQQVRVQDLDCRRGQAVKSVRCVVNLRDRAARVIPNAVPMARGLTASRPAEGCGPAGPAAANFLSSRFEPAVKFTKPA